MVASGEVTISQDGGPAKLHPYLVALVRWCVSCIWSTATVLLHRIIIRPLPQIAGSGIKLSKPRPAGREHLHPEPKVECVVLHQPDVHNLDVIFVHGLYGSLCNTWRQGEWRLKYPSSPKKIHLRRPAASPSPCKCPQCEQVTEKIENDDHKDNFSKDSSVTHNPETVYGENKYEYRFNDYDRKYNNETNMINNYDSAFRNIDENFYKDITRILPKDDDFIAEKFYNNTLLDQVEIIENYETQAKFVSDLFKNCDNTCDPDVGEEENDFLNVNKNNEDQIVNNGNYQENCMCTDKPCEVGCGCICDDCYSPCWPKDWIKYDYPNARVISINYTSDPHLWRPLWIKENKRLCLHERAKQMTEQLLELGVGQKPVIWVGHSKGGLFIKQIYCEAYEAYLKVHPDELEKHQTSYKKKLNEKSHNKNRGLTENANSNRTSIIEYENNVEQNRNKNLDWNMNANGDKNDNPTSLRVENDSLLEINCNDDFLKKQAALWYNSGAFMFYSVPHRGSPLADFKTPITARSIELMEISKDNSLVLTLQERWLRATAPSEPLVRSLVETRRTLMSVLWLRIVDTDSADPGIGALCGVPVDHREICKPSSRHCLLYTELSAIISAALNKFKNLS